MLFTVFTPAYNRASLLERAYRSLCVQNFRDFEWLIVDDGSTDSTAEAVKRFRAEASFPVRYIYKENGGKHTAVNLGTREARGELFFILDSDDSLPAGSLSTVAEIYAGIKDDASFAGVCGLDGDLSGKVIGSGLPSHVIDGTNIEVRLLLGIKGDMKEVFRTAVLREFPFPEIPGERFCPEILVWNRIATRYRLRFFDRIIYLAEYQPTGITSVITRVRMQSPGASMMTYAEMTRYSGVPLRVRVKAAVNYWRFRLCRQPSTPRVPIGGKWCFAFPPGALMHLMDIWKVK